MYVIKHSVFILCKMFAELRHVQNGMQNSLQGLTESTESQLPKTNGA